MVRAIARALRSAEIDEHERITLRGEKMPVFCTTVATHRRALLILDALAEAAEARGHRALVGRPSTDGERWQLRFEVGGEQIDASLVETLTVVQRERDTREMLGVASTVYVPSGRLQFTPHRAGWREKGWSDTEKRSLEQRLGRIVITAEAVAQARKEQREESERRRRAELEAEQMRRQAERRAKHGEALRQHLHATMERWQRAQHIQAFVRAVENAVADREYDASLIAWLGWAERYARSLDPFSDIAAIAMPLEPSQLDDASQLR